MTTNSVTVPGTDGKTVHFRIFSDKNAPPDFPHAACIPKNNPAAYPDMWFLQSPGSLANEKARAFCRGNKRDRIPPCPHLRECTDWAKKLEGTPDELFSHIAGEYESPRKQKKKQQKSRAYASVLRTCPVCSEEFISNKKTYCSNSCKEQEKSARARERKCRDAESAETPPTWINPTGTADVAAAFAPVSAA